MVSSLVQPGAAGKAGDLVHARRELREEHGSVRAPIVLVGGKKQGHVFLGQDVDVDKEKSAETCNL